MTVCVLEEGKKEKEKDFLLFFNQKCLHWCGASPSEMLCCESGLEQSVKFHGGLGLIPSPQLFPLATLVAAFVEPVLEVPNNPLASYPKLGCMGWTQGLISQDCSPGGLPYKGSKLFNSFAKLGMGLFVCKCFYISYCCQTSPTASKSKVTDPFAPSTWENHGSIMPSHKQQFLVLCWQDIVID